eukprot:GHVP01047577.1.p1 GENE.GHVP01047577.1~~GHVP01047577.1.p1  ORF type:complete len:152 (+),score=30.76 GHVP01047577.1:48-458(+)
MQNEILGIFWNIPTETEDIYAGAVQGFGQGAGQLRRTFQPNQPQQLQQHQQPQHSMRRTFGRFRRPTNVEFSRTSRGVPSMEGSSRGGGHFLRREQPQPVIDRFQEEIRPIADPEPANVQEYESSDVEEGSGIVVN